jgi:Flp pilus assembly protein TadD
VAFVQWKAAVEVSPNLGEAHNNLAVIHMMNGRKAEAEAAVKSAEKAGFKVNPQLKADIRKLN